MAFRIEVLIKTGRGQPRDVSFFVNHQPIFFVFFSSTRNPSINNIAMAIPRKRSSTSTDTPPVSTSVIKKAKVTHDATLEPALAARASSSPSHRRSGGVTSTVLWIRNPPSHLPLLKENPWMEKGFVGHFTQIKVGPYISR
jgi:hypothetical protein